MLAQLLAIRLGERRWSKLRIGRTNQNRQQTEGRMARMTTGLETWFQCGWFKFS